MMPYESVLTTIGRTLWAVSWQVAVLVAFIGILALIFRKASSSFRYVLWCVVLVRLMIPVKLELPVISWSGLSALFPGRIPSFARAIDLPAVVRELPESSGVVAGPAASNSGVATSSLYAVSMLPMILAVLWLVCVTGAGILLARFLLRTHRSLNECPPIGRADLNDLADSLRRNMGIAREVPLRYMTIPGHDGPAVAGILHPSIYLPPSIADNWEARDIEPILLHELSHIRRHDIVINMLQAAAQVIYFFHPLVWLANSRIRALREEACDDISIGMLGNHSGRYAESILNFIREPLTQSSLAYSGIGFGEGSGTVHRRVRRIMGKGYTPGRRLGVLSVAAILALGTAGLVLSSEQDAKVKTYQTNKALAATGMLDKIAIKSDGTLDAERKDRIAKFLTDPAGKNKIVFRIARGYGDKAHTPDALNKVDASLVDAVKRYTNIDARADAQTLLSADALFNAQFIYVSSDVAADFTAQEKANFGAYLRSGGFAFIDNGAPDKAGSAVEYSLQKMLTDALGADAVIRPIPADHAIYHSLFDFQGPPTGQTGEASLKRFQEKKALQGIWIGKRLAAVYSDFGHGYRWVTPDRSEPQVKLGVNLVVYALLQENGMMTGNAKK